MTAADALRAALAAAIKVTFSISYQGEADPEFDIKEGWNVQRTKVDWNGKGSLYNRPRVFATRAAADWHIEREQAMLARRHGRSVIATIKTYEVTESAESGTRPSGPSL